jgi:HSP20 family protein
MSYWDDDFEEWFRKFMGRPRFGLVRDVLGDIEQMKKEMERRFREQFPDVPKELTREYETPEGIKVREVGPIVYGYSVTIGPDGKPRVKEFGNVRRLGTTVPQLSAEREPMSDTIVSDTEVQVVVELPGVEKERIKVNATEGSVDVSAESEGRKYHRVIDIPSDADISTAKSTYRNGILEIHFKRKGELKGRAIKID